MTARPAAELRREVEPIVREHLDKLDDLRRSLLDRASRFA